MTAVTTMIERNIKVFFLNRASVFFSLLSMLIIIMLYALFLGDLNVQSIQATTGDVEGIRWLVDTWIMAGILVVNSVTVSMGVFGIMVQDREEKRLQAFLVSPVSRGRIVLGYVLSAWIIGAIMTTITFLAAIAYIVAGGGEVPDAFTAARIFGLILLNVFSGTCFVFFLVNFARSSNALGAMATILGTMIGFVTGIYIPIGVLPEGVQTFTKLIPATHGTTLMRQVFTQAAADKVFAGAPQAVREAFFKEMGITMYWGGSPVPDWIMLLVLAGSGLLFLGLSVLVLRKKRD